MDRNFAEHIKALLERINIELDDSVRLVMERSPHDEFFRYRRAAGKAMGILYFEVLRLIYDEYPDLTPPGLRKE